MLNRIVQFSKDYNRTNLFNFVSLFDFEFVLNKKDQYYWNQLSFKSFVLLNLSVNKLINTGNGKETANYLIIVIY